MKTFIPFICFFFLLLLNTFFRWPVDNGKITSTFGESRGDHFHDGVDIISSNNRVYPVADGELLYFWDKSIFPIENYPGGGNYKIIKHDDNIYSIYMHLTEGLGYNKFYMTNETLGSIGNTGRSYGKHLHFSLLNIFEKRSINPFILLPEYTDIQQPKILDLYIRVADRYFIINDNTNIRITRHYPLLINIIDSINRRERLGIFRLRVIFNNQKAMELDFSEIAYSKNGLTIGGKTFQNLFDEKGYYKICNITYNDGLNHLKVVTSDYSGNESTKEISFTVKLEII
ncbi:MAG: M23 family metallopeptidase [Spirochaetota bacterium]|nr:M23 family metallopeptidase [Spirochaetota bacterium]